jgi:hypothetical protein
MVTFPRRLAAAADGGLPGAYPGEQPDERLAALHQQHGRKDRS